jgi:hypothetical protein
MAHFCVLEVILDSSLSFDLLGWLSISSGWPVVLSSLKALLESGEALLLQA